MGASNCVQILRPAYKGQPMPWRSRVQEIIAPSPWERDNQESYAELAVGEANNSISEGEATARVEGEGMVIQS